MHDFHSRREFNDVQADRDSESVVDAGTRLVNVEPVPCNRNPGPRHAIPGPDRECANSSGSIGNDCGLDLVSVGVAQEGSVVSRAVVGSRTGRSFVHAARFESGGMECVDRFARRRDEADAGAVSGGRAPLVERFAYPELRKPLSVGHREVAEGPKVFKRARCPRSQKRQRFAVCETPARRDRRVRPSGSRAMSRRSSPPHPVPSRHATARQLGQEHHRDTVIRDPHPSDTGLPV